MRCSASSQSTSRLSRPTITDQSIPETAFLNEKLSHAPHSFWVSTKGKLVTKAESLARTNWTNSLCSHLGGFAYFHYCLFVFVTSSFLTRSYFMICNAMDNGNLSNDYVSPKRALGKIPDLLNLTATILLLPFHGSNHNEELQSQSDQPSGLPRTAPFF